MCGVQRVPPISFLNNGKYNAGLLKGLSPPPPHTHTHTHFPIYQLKGSVYEKYIYIEQNLLQCFCKMCILEENVTESL